MTNKLTQKELKERVHYNPSTGQFNSLICKQKKINLGSLDKYGYIRICLKNKFYPAHRLAFLYIEGYLPENGIDHINRIKHDNKWKNLREVSQQCNLRNTGNISTNTSGVKGVYFLNQIRKWRADIMINYKSHSLGNYDDFNEAVCARLAGEQCINWAGCDSNSPAYKYVKENIQC